MPCRSLFVCIHDSYFIDKCRVVPFLRKEYMFYIENLYLKGRIIIDVCQIQNRQSILKCLVLSNSL